MSRPPDRLSTAEWITAFLAMAGAASVVASLVYFARITNRHPDLVNWFGIAVAVGAAVAFELFKFAVTFRSRHEERLAMRITLTPLRVDELRELTGAIEEQRKVKAAIAAAVELKARELQAERERKALNAEAEALAQRLEALQQEESRLGMDAREGDEELLRAYTLLHGQTDIVERLIVSTGNALSYGLAPLFPGLGRVADALRDLSREAYTKSRIRRLRRQAAFDAESESREGLVAAERLPAGEDLEGAS